MAFAKAHLAARNKVRRAVSLRPPRHKHRRRHRPCPWKSACIGRYSFLCKTDYSIKDPTHFDTGRTNTVVALRRTAQSIIRILLPNLQFPTLRLPTIAEQQHINFPLFIAIQKIIHAALRTYVMVTQKLQAALIEDLLTHMHVTCEVIESVRPPIRRGRLQHLAA